MYRDPKKNFQTMLTSRPKAIKALEETYGVKYQNPSSKSTMKAQMKSATMPIEITLKDRGDMEYNETLSSYRPNCNRYIITASDRYEKALPPTARRRGVSFNPSSDSTSLLEERRAEVLSKQQQYFSKVEKPVSARPTTTKLPKTARNVLDITEEEMRRIQHENFARNRSVNSENDVERVRHEAHRHNQHRNDTRPKDTSNDDKDDTEEFIVLIKREIEKSVTKSLSEMMKTQLAEINAKVERQAADIKKIGSLVQKINNNLSSKITHYGEENSRHFRYLCMKSEYDKMFYQHQNQVAVKPQPPAQPSLSNDTTDSTTQNEQLSTAQPSARTLVPENSVSPAEMPKNPVDDNVRGMVAQLKKFCLDYESKVILDEGDTSSSSIKSNNAFGSFQHSYTNEEANFSSDGMTPRSMDNESNSSKKKLSKPSSKQQSTNNFFKNTSGGGDD